MNSSFNDTTITTPNGNAKQPSSLSPPDTPPSSPPSAPAATASINITTTTTSSTSPPPPPMPSTNNLPAANKNGNTAEELYDIPVGEYFFPASDLHFLATLTQHAHTHSS